MTLQVHPVDVVNGVEVTPVTPADMSKGIDLGFRGITCTVPLKKKKGETGPDSKTILRDVNGVARAGRLLAIMGPSGAGKTTMLDVLAGRRSYSGELSLGGRSSAPGDILQYAAYVQQDDAIMPSQTAREAVHMAALLTLPDTMTVEAKRAKAEETLAQFSLVDCGDTKVGDAVGKVKGLSGGERKRCAVAMAAVRQPQILFLDEPTSGLDAFKAHLLIKVMKNLAQSANATIVCTIHQPSSDIFAMFDDLLLLLGGTMVFNGQAADAVAHFAGAGYQCPQFANPADFFFMHVLTAPDGSSADDGRIRELSQAYEGSEIGANTAKLVVSAFSGGSGGAIAKPIVSNKSSMWMQFRVLLRRQVNDLKRNPMRGRVFIAQSVIMGLILSLIWFQVGHDQTGVQDRAGVLFFITTNGVMMNIMGVLTTFANERGAVIREQENGMYTILPYFLSRVLVDIPLKFLGPFLFGTEVYWLVGFQNDVSHYLSFIFITILLALAGNGMGLCLACAFPDVTVALAVAPLMILPLIMFSGFVLNTDSIPVFLQWVEYISPPKYAFAALAQIEYTGLDLHCTEDQYKRVVTKNGQTVELCSFQTGEDYLQTLNIQEALTVPVCAALLVAIAVVFTILAYLGLVLITRKSNRVATGPSGPSLKSEAKTSAKPQDV
eukprot:TRINITY_DN24414_c0_g1_i1.p1 TRINITY_DN24414_c0_g1~~TRINITY_DN24414_c0_g1_i1.p1  ORF type:complete len:663 (+),score=98.59 TRINITY_DN24414_c0_g1_i1:38-2026(+)